VAVPSTVEEEFLAVVLQMMEELDIAANVLYLHEEDDFEEKLLVSGNSCIDTRNRSCGADLQLNDGRPSGEDQVLLERAMPKLEVVTGAGIAVSPLLMWLNSEVVDSSDVLDGG
jgi:hypothetical protein